MKIKEEELKLIQEQQGKLSRVINDIGIIETKKHALLHEIAEINTAIEEYKEVLEKEYGAVNINLEDGTYTNIEQDVKDNKKD